MMKKILCAMTAALLTAGCEIEKTIDYDTFYDGDMMILNAFLSVEDGLKATLKKSLAPDNVNGNYKVADATVTLWCGDEMIATAETKNNVDFVVLPSSVSLNHHDSYHVEAVSQSLGRIYSDAMMIPEPIEVVKTTVERYGEEVPEGEDGDLMLWFDNKSATTAYAWESVGFKRGKEKRDNWLGFIRWYKNYGIGMGACVAGHTYRSVHSMYDSVRYDLLTLSDEIVKFCDSKDDYSHTYDDVFYERPYPVYTNMHGGYGFFGTYGRSSVWRD